MKTLIKKRIEKIGATIMTAALALTLIPTITDGEEVRAEWVKSRDNTELGTTQIAAPVVPEDMDCKWDGSYVYYGTYDEGHLRFRVLAPHTTKYGSDTMLLDCNSVLDMWEFDSKSDDWLISDMRTFLNEDFYQNSFTAQEKKAIAFSSYPGYEDYSSAKLKNYFKYTTALDNDKIFLLDAADLVNTDYGYTEEPGYYNSQSNHSVIPNRYKERKGSICSWWLRSGYPSTLSKYVGTVTLDGIVDVCECDYDYIGFSPAMNIDLSSVLFSSVVSGTAGQPGAEYKLTVFDPDLKVEVSTELGNRFDGPYIEVPYKVSGVKATKNTQTSVLILDKEFSKGNKNGAKILSYQKINSLFDDGWGFFEFPSTLNSDGWNKDYFVYIVAENLNGAYETDFASEPVKLDQPQQHHFVVVNDDGNGTVSASHEVALPGMTVTLQATPNKGYHFKTWKVISGGITIKDNSFVMGSEQVEIKAIFEKDGAPATPTPTTAPNPTATATPTAAPTNPANPTVAPSGAVTPTPAPADPKSQIMAFVERIYTFVLDREPEAEGAAFWSDELYAFRRSGAEVAQGFIFSPEFENRKTSDKDFVTILYKTFFGRDPEEEGMNFWLTQLSTGAMDRVAVANGFIYSQEWADTCATYGIRSGGDVKPSVTIEPTELTYKFVERMYTTAMKRESDEEGKKYWAGELSNFNITGEQVGAAFFLSEEMASFKLDDKEFVNRLYLTFMDREADEDGAKYWVDTLASGAQRSDVVFGFTRSAEFTAKCVEARILPY